jgi:hypothetical protein
MDGRDNLERSCIVDWLHRGFGARLCSASIARLLIRTFLPRTRTAAMRGDYQCPPA